MRVSSGPEGASIIPPESKRLGKRRVDARHTPFWNPPCPGLWTEAAAFSRKEWLSLTSTDKHSIVVPMGLRGKASSLYSRCE